MEALTVALGAIITALLTVLIRSVNRLDNSIGRIYGKIEEFRVHVAENYVTKEHLKDFCEGRHER